MEANLHEYIVYDVDVERINSPAFYDCVVHLLCRDGEGRLRYNEREFQIAKGQIAVLSQPRNALFVSCSTDFECEYIAAPYKFIRNLLPANNYSIQGHISLFANPIINVDSQEAEKFHTDLRNISRRIDDTGHRFYAVNFTSLSYFTRYCQKHLGTSPSRFRTPPKNRQG